MENPKIRFKGYTEDWEQRKLGDVLVILKDGTHGTHKDTESGPLLLSAKNIKNGTVQWDESDRRISEDEYNSIHSKFQLQKGDVLLTIVGSIGETAILSQSEGVTFQRSVAFLRPSDEISSEFLYSEIQGQKFQKELNDRKSTSAQPGIYLGDLGAIPIEFPTSDEEQLQIGSYFRQLDHLITLHQRKCDLTKNLKKYMLQKMFPQDGAKVPEIRFEGFTDDWEQRKFNDIATRESYACSSASDIPSVEYEDVVTEEGRLNKDIYSKETVKSGIKFNGSQVLYGKLRPYLHNWLNPDFKGVAVGDWWVLKPINMDKNFLYRLIQTQQFDNIANQSSGSKMPRADWNLISDSKFMVPLSKVEQSKIGGYFDCLDYLITLHQRKCDELKNMKKFMLQNMFV